MSPVRRIAALLVALVWFGAAHAALARQQCSIVADSDTFTGLPFSVTIMVESPDAVSPPPMPDIAGLDLQYVTTQSSSVQSTTIVNGRVTRNDRVTQYLVYRGVAERAGRFTIPAIRIETAGGECMTEPLPITVADVPRDDRFALEVSVDNPSPFVGQPVVMTLRWLIPTGAQVRTPAFSFPGFDGVFEMLPDEVPPPAASDSAVLEMLGQRVRAYLSNQTIGGQAYDVLTIRRLIVPLQAGRQEIGPVSADFQAGQRARTAFGGVDLRRVRAQAEPVTLDVRALPERGRPDAFSGLVGTYEVSAAVDAKSVSVGDPIALRVTVRGPRARALTPDSLNVEQSLGDRFRVTREPDAQADRADARTFAYTVRPLSDRASQIPALGFWVFDAGNEKYARAQSRPIPLTVRGGRTITEQDVPTGVLSEQPWARRAAPGLAPQLSVEAALADGSFSLGRALVSPLGLATVALPPAAYAALAWLAAARRRTDAAGDRSRSVGRALRDMAIAIAHSRDHTALESAIRQGVSPIVGVAAQAVTAAGLADALAGALGPDAGAHAAVIERSLGACEAARYSGATAGPIEETRREAEQAARALEGLVGR